MSRGPGKGASFASRRALFEPAQLRRIVAGIVPLYGRRGTRGYLERLLRLCFDEIASLDIDDDAGPGLRLGRARAGGGWQWCRSDDTVLDLLAAGPRAVLSVALVHEDEPITQDNDEQRSRRSYGVLRAATGIADAAVLLATVTLDEHDRLGPGSIDTAQRRELPACSGAAGPGCRSGIAGELNVKGIRVQLWTGGWNPGERKHARHATLDRRVEPTSPFDQTFGIPATEAMLDSENSTLSLEIRSDNACFISLVAVEFSWRLQRWW